MFLPVTVRFILSLASPYSLCLFLFTHADSERINLFLSAKVHEEQSRLGELQRKAARINEMPKVCAAVVTLDVGQC